MVTSSHSYNGAHSVNLKFNNIEWIQIQRGARKLYADEVILKPTHYSFVKWCALTYSNYLEDNEIE